MEDTQEGGHLQTRKRAFISNGQLLDLQLPSQQDYEKKISCLSHSIYGLLLQQSKQIKTKILSKHQ
jgi:hypothetical protein